MLEVTEIQTEPITEPVTLAEVKEYLRLDADYDLEDAVLTRFIVSARQWCEKYTGLSFVPKTLHLSTDKCNIELLYGPVKSITSVTDLLDANIEYVKAGNNVLVGRNTGVNVIYTAGYETLPETLKTAVKMLSASLYDNRDATSEVIPMGVISLLRPYSRSGGLFL